MHNPHLGPHTVVSPSPHPRHHEWLTRFSPSQRRHLIEEDYHARLQICGILVGEVVLGLALLVTVLLIAM